MDLKLKIVRNKKNGQLLIFLPRKKLKLKSSPKFIEIQRARFLEG